MLRIFKNVIKNYSSEIEWRFYLCPAVKSVNAIKCQLINGRNDSEKTDIKRKSVKRNKVTKPLKMNPGIQSSSVNK
jgi:hypothetical protein